MPASLSGTRAASTTRGDRDSPKGRALYWYVRPSNANRRNGLCRGRIETWNFRSFRSIAANQSWGWMHLIMRLVQSPVQDSQIEDWPKATTFLGYNEVRAVNPLPHLGWRDRLDCILCQEDSNLLAQDRGVPDCHRRLENAVELGRSPGELNRVAESNCAREPARQAGQREPRLQTLCKRLQRHNRRTCGGAAKGSRGGWHKRRCILRHPHRTPWVPNGTGQRCVGRNVVPEPYSLGYWQNGLWARVRRQGVAHCHPMSGTKQRWTALWRSALFSSTRLRSKNLMSGCTCRPFIPVCTGSGSGMQNPLANFIGVFSLVRDVRGFQVNPLCHHDITRSDRQIGN